LIEYLESQVVYENPRPHVRSRHGYFPGMVRLPSGELLCLFVLGEAFEAPNCTTWITRSSDNGRTWTLQGPLHEAPAGLPNSDALKATVLTDGSLIAVGYRFHRLDPEKPIGIEETGGILPGDDLVSFSRDEGRSWSEPKVIPRTWPELLEISGPCAQSASGDLIAVAAPYKMPDGSNPSGQVGMLLRSRDAGRSWDDRTIYFCSEARNLTPLEGRISEMEPGRLVALVWAYDYVADRHYPNHVTFSRDNGHTWSVPEDTGHWGQASGVLSLGDDLLATIHAHRGQDPGLYVRVIDASNDRWHPLEETVIWGGQLRQQTREGQNMVQMFNSLRFGQPSVIRVGPDEFIATHWSIEEGQGKIRSHRFRIGRS
jgi:sialidase-1